MTEAYDSSKDRLLALAVFEQELAQLSQAGLCSIDACKFQ